MELEVFSRPADHQSVYSIFFMDVHTTTPSFFRVFFSITCELSKVDFGGIYFQGPNVNIQIIFRGQNKDVFLQGHAGH